MTFKLEITSDQEIGKVSIEFNNSNNGNNGNNGKNGKNGNNGNNGNDKPYVESEKLKEAYDVELGAGFGESLDVDTDYTKESMSAEEVAGLLEVPDIRDRPEKVDRQFSDEKF